MKLAVLVADYTPGEADALRRDMASWRSHGKIEQHRERLIGRMVANGIDRAFAERVYSQIQGFGEYGFPESHAASFALIAYITAWLRCHHPAAFCCALLNALPMGFYAASTIVEDARRHGVTVHPVDIRYSAWDCTLEREGVRMGYRFVKGLGPKERVAIERELATEPFASAEDFARRTRLSRGALHALAEAGGFSSFGSDRRQAIWTMHGFYATQDDRLDLGTDAAPRAAQPSFACLRTEEAIVWDYRTSLHSTRGHPIECIRPELRHRGIPTAAQVNRSRDGRALDYVGLVICRQRPGTASGVTFYTLEDETGFVNVVVWNRVFERYVILAKTAVVLGVRGKIQSESGVVHLVADRLWEPDLELVTEGTTQRSFH